MNRVTARTRVRRNQRRRYIIGLALIACMPLAAGAQDDVLDRLAENTRLIDVIERATSPAETPRGVPVIRVGNDPDCDFTASSGSNGLQTAMDAAAIDANGAGLTEIRVADTGDYTGRRYFLNDAVGGDQTVDIIGGYATCASATPSGTTTLDRAGATGPVILIDSAAAPETINLENLVIRGAGGTGAIGGLHIHNNNNVVTRNVSISFNQGDIGGGVRVTGAGGDTSLVMVTPGGVQQNTALTTGGGIYCSGPNTSVILDAGVSLSSNQSDGNAGGFHLANGCALLSLSSFPSGIYNNTAETNGGGGVVTSGSSITLFGGTFFGLGNADSVTTLDNNSANTGAGGVFAVGAGSLVEVLDSWIGSNDADADGDGSGPGGGVWVTDGAELRMDRTLNGNICPDPLRCTRLHENSASSGGGIFATGNNVSVDIRQTWIENNQADGIGPAMMLTNSAGDPAQPALLFMEGNMVVNNPTSGISAGTVRGTVDLQFNTQATIAYTTFADNLLDSSGRNILLFEDVDVSLFSSILWESAGQAMFSSEGWEGTSTGVVDCLISHESGSLPPGASFVDIGDPLFADPAEGDYRLGPGSPAIDFCDTVVYNPVEEDIEGMPRGFDVPSMPNILGPMDLGAHEYASTIAGGSVQFATSIVEASENIGSKIIEIQRTGGTEGPASYLLETVDGTAVAGTDYIAVSTLLEWDDGQGDPIFTSIPILNDEIAVPDRYFRVQLTRAGGAAEAGNPTSLMVVIREDDGDRLFIDSYED